jgi:hypothetical protein
VSVDTREIDAVLAELRAGGARRVPFDTTLGPDTQAVESVLRAGDDGGFELTTTFREFWAGHGWSLEQRETEVLTEAQVRAALARVSSPLP